MWKKITDILIGFVHMVSLDVSILSMWYNYCDSIEGKSDKRTGGTARNKL